MDASLRGGGGRKKRPMDASLRGGGRKKRPKDALREAIDLCVFPIF